MHFFLVRSLLGKHQLSCVGRVDESVDRAGLRQRPYERGGANSARPPRSRWLTERSPTNSTWRLTPTPDGRQRSESSSA